jgi:hypothetical protein
MDGDLVIRGPEDFVKAHNAYDLKREQSRRLHRKACELLSESVDCIGHVRCPTKYEQAGRYLRQHLQLVRECHALEVQLRAWGEDVDECPDAVEFDECCFDLDSPFGPIPTGH